MLNFRAIIPAAGRSSRSGLSYPKTLYKLEGVPILIRICILLKEYDPHPVIIINPVDEKEFRTILDEHKIDATLVFQNEPHGMGDAILKADGEIDTEAQVILIWSDIPLLNSTTLKHLVNCHIACANDLSLVTSIGKNCYTIVEREDGRLLRIKETRRLGIKPEPYGERDIGLFVFKKKPVFDILKGDTARYKTEFLGPHDFLYILEELSIQKKKIEGYPIALPGDVLSFNTPEELRIIEKIIGEAAAP